MKRIASLLLLAGLLFGFAPAIGCSEKTTSYERSERIEESEPQMASPGTERVE